MLSLPASLPRFVAKQVLHLVSQPKALEVKRLPTNGSLIQELPLDLIDFVDMLLAAESYLTLPYDLLLIMLSDFVEGAMNELLDSIGS